MSDAERLAQVKEKAKVLPEPFRSANLWMPDDTRVTYDRIGYWIPIPWDNHGGRATLCGDAAHPMTPRTVSPLL
jgi:2-polyprenyl-6-methoxyphenol hydroxylase-like FAD-dependent oxidoreductase